MRPAIHLCCIVDVSARGGGCSSYCVKWHLVLEVTNFSVISSVLWEVGWRLQVSENPGHFTPKELHCRATGLQEHTCLAGRNLVVSTTLLFSLYSLTHWRHKKLSNVFMALSLTEATPGLNLNVVNNTLVETKQSWAMEEEHVQDCAQEFCTVFRRGLGEEE